MSSRFNVGDKITIMNGIQAYRTRTPELVREEIQRCRLLGINVGIKLVRGAYMVEERRLAEKHGYPSPIWNDLKGTHDSYNSSMLYAFDHIKEQDQLFLGSHNQETIEIAMQTIKEKPHLADGRVSFGQLKGFSDQMTGTLACGKFQVYKYLPYGPTEDVCPYLLRRG